MFCELVDIYRTRMGYVGLIYNQLQSFSVYSSLFSTVKSDVAQCGSAALSCHLSIETRSYKLTQNVAAQIILVGSILYCF